MRRGGRRRRRSRMGGRLPARRRPSSRLPCARARQCLDDRTLATRAESRSGSLIEWRSVSCPTSTRRLLRLNRPSSKGLSTSSSSERPIRSSVRCGRRTSRTSGFPLVRVSPRSAVALGRWRARLRPNLVSRRLLASTRHRSSSPRAESLRGISRISGSSRATRARSRWRTDRSTCSCSTPPSAMSPVPSCALTEASRVLVAGGLLAIFDGDYATTTLRVRRL